MNDHHLHLSPFCHQALASLPRSDQRRWGEIYVRGLVTVPGRKSIRRIAESVVGKRVDQGLQQFLNQSPWRSDLVRRDLVQQLDPTFRPRAWVVQETAFRKNGGNSVGVDRQYAPSAGRMMNCQLALGVFLAGEGGVSPVNWRLMLPQRWGDEAHLRAAAHVPDDEWPRTRWEYVLDAIDEMTGEWGMPPAPVVVDARNERSVEPVLLRGLEERGLHYFVRVGRGTPVFAGTGGNGPDGATAGQVATRMGRGAGMTLSWRDTAHHAHTLSRFGLEPLVGLDQSMGRGVLRHRSRRLLAEWRGREPQASGLWLTNLAALRIPELIGLARLPRRVEPEVDALHDEFGLTHFEGRSFRGWHHHVTLVSLAHAYAANRAATRPERRTEAEPIPLRGA